MLKKELLTVEFKYVSGRKYRDEVITLGIYNTIDDAVESGNNVINELSKYFTIKEEDRFSTDGICGRPNRLVTNVCYPSQRISFFAKITPLILDDLNNTVERIFKAADRFDKYE